MFVPTECFWGLNSRFPQCTAGTTAGRNTDLRRFQDNWQSGRLVTGQDATMIENETLKKRQVTLWHNQMCVVFGSSVTPVLTIYVYLLFLLFWHHSECASHIFTDMLKHSDGAKSFVGVFFPSFFAADSSPSWRVRGIALYPNPHPVMITCPVLLWCVYWFTFQCLLQCLLSAALQCVHVRLQQLITLMDRLFDNISVSLLVRGKVSKVSFCFLMYYFSSSTTFL